MVFDDWYGSPFLVLKANLNINELEIFKHEVVQYTKHIKALDQGTASIFCYKYPENRKGRVLGRNLEYRKLLDMTTNNRGDYEELPYILKLVREDGQDVLNDEEFESEDMVQIKNLEFNKGETIAFFRKPYDSSDEFYMGYGMLPFTELLINNN